MLQTPAASEVVLNERQRRKYFNIVLIGLHNFHRFGPFWHTLAIYLDSLKFCIALLLIFSLTRLRNASLQRDFRRCSKRTWSRLRSWRFPTTFVTSTPIAFLFTLNTTPVRPW